LPADDLCVCEGESASKEVSQTKEEAMKTSIVEEEGIEKQMVSKLNYAKYSCNAMHLFTYLFQVAQ